MTFNIEFMKEKSNLFWDAYFHMLELTNQDFGKRLEETPLVREIDIDEDYSLRVGRNKARWKLVVKLTNAEICEVVEIDIATRAFELLHTYLDRSV